jgi:hypothetical protein
MLMATLTTLVTFGGPASAADHIKLGYMATLSGPFGLVGEEQQRGLNLALEELGNKLGGDPFHRRRQSQSVRGGCGRLKAYRAGQG